MIHFIYEEIEPAKLIRLVCKFERMGKIIPMMWIVLDSFKYQRNINLSWLIFSNILIWIYIWKWVTDSAGTYVRCFDLSTILD